MSIKFHPQIGTIVICDYNTGFRSPEMVKRRPAIIVSPRFRSRPSLCSIVPLSTTPPTPPMPYHYKLMMDTPLPRPYHSMVQWVKADMITTIAFDRLNLPFNGKDANGRRIYEERVIEKNDLAEIRKCILSALGMNFLTEYV
jgi:mRNA interferase MazF